MRQAAPVKKLVIKPFKEKPKLPDNFEDEAWNKLRAAVVAIHSSSQVTSSFQELYTTVQEMCLHNLSAKVLSQLQELCEQNTAVIVGNLVGQSPDPVEFLSVINDTWNSHCAQMTTIREVFMYLDRSYVLQSTVHRSLWDYGVSLFRKNLKSNEEVEKKTLQGLLTLIARERNGDAVDRSLLKNLLRMLSNLGIYEESFVKMFISEASAFYRADSLRLLSELDMANYLKYVERSLHQENDRVSAYMSITTRKPLISAVESELLEQHANTIIEKGFEDLMNENRLSDLERMYQLLGRVNAHPLLKSAFSIYTRKVGSGIVGNEEGEKDLVDNLLDLKQKLDTIVAQSFESNEEMQHALRDGLEFSVNIRQNKPAQLLAKFVDARLRGGKTASEEELESVLDRVMVIFRFIQGKDVFEAFYKKDLAKRLLMGKSASIDAEKSMISKLKQQCGSAFTNKLEGMFKDIDLSYDIMTSFKESAVARTLLSHFDMSVHVLTTGFWPHYPPAPLLLHKALAVCQDTFRMFYLSKYSGRKLAWQHSLGHCTLKTRFPQGIKELQVSLFQTVILLMFNDADDIPFRDIADTTGMEDKELRITLQSLACAKLRVLQKKPKGRDIEDGDVFSFNKEFTNKLLRIKINTIQMKETPEEAQNTTEKVFQDRQYLIDAAIVRIMKARKTLAHQLLISELFKQLKFPVTPAVLKKRIESLIEREYLERDPSNSSIFNYVA